jgi:hypothetical protein
MLYPQQPDPQIAGRKSTKSVCSTKAKIETLVTALKATRTTAEVAEYPSKRLPKIS